MKSILIGLLAPALFAGAAASQTIAVPRAFPYAGVPRGLPAPSLPLPLGPATLPSPLTMPEARLNPPLSAPEPLLADTVVLAAARLPAIAVDGKKELPFDIRRYLPVEKRLAAATQTLERPSPKTGPSPAPADVARKTLRELERLFDGRELTLPEDDLERELGLK